MNKTRTVLARIKPGFEGYYEAVCHPLVNQLSDGEVVEVEVDTDLSKPLPMTFSVRSPAKSVVYKYMPAWFLDFDVKEQAVPGDQPG